MKDKLIDVEINLKLEALKILELARDAYKATLKEIKTKEGNWALFITHAGILRVVKGKEKIKEFILEAKE